MRSGIPILPLSFMILLAAAGCGTRSIVVPVTRPAAIDLHDCSLLALAPAHDSGPATAMGALLRSKLDGLLPAVLSAALPGQVVQTETDERPLITARGTIDLTEAASIAAHAGASCVMLLDLSGASYFEEVVRAELRSSRTPGSAKHVRQGRADAHCRVLLIDVDRRAVTFVDTIHIASSHETHAVDADPPALDRDLFAAEMAQQIAGALQEALQPVQDRELVTFLVDDAWPEIQAAIVHAEEGRWSAASSLLQGLADGASDMENADILWYNLGVALQYQQLFADALSAFERAIALNDKSRYHHAIDDLMRAEREYLERLQQQR